jgi:hypothetical protein
MRRRSAGVCALVSPANMGATPIGSIVTSRVTKVAIQGSMAAAAYLWFGPRKEKRPGVIVTSPAVGESPRERYGPCGKV